MHTRHTQLNVVGQILKTYDDTVVVLIEGILLLVRACKGLNPHYSVTQPLQVIHIHHILRTIQVTFVN